MYSLGATLYGLLTGQPPFAGEAGEVLRAVQNGRLPATASDRRLDRPGARVRLPQGDGDEAEDRYATSRALAEDVERWMADEPVTAWREPFSRRARRWARRNRTAVTTAAAAVLVALAGTATVLAVQTRANRDLREANARTLHERDLARQNFDLARKAVDDYLTRVGQNPLLKEQGLHDLRQELLEAALGYYRDFLRQRGDDPTLKADAAAAHERVGDILIELGRYGDALAALRPGPRSDRAARPRAAGRPRDGHRAGPAPGGPAPGAQGRRLVFGGDRRLRPGEGPRRGAPRRGRGHRGPPQDPRPDLPQRRDRLPERAGPTTPCGPRLRAHELAERATNDRPGDLSAACTLLHVSITREPSLLQTKGRHDEARALCEQDIAFGKARVARTPPRR